MLEGTPATWTPRRRWLCTRSRFTASLLDTIVARRRSSFRERESSTLSLISVKTATLWMKWPESQGILSVMTMLRQLTSYLTMELKIRAWGIRYRRHLP